MNKKLAVIAVLSVVTIIISGFQSSMLYGTEYMTTKSNYSFTVSSGDDWWNCNWSYCKKITIDHTKVQSDLTNYPVLLYRQNDSDLAARAQDDGGDIVFIDKYNSTQYKHEIEFFDGATGELDAWVKIPSLSSSSDTILYMYYGNPTCNNQQNISGTWNSNYKMVQHLNESSGSLLDSTTNDNDGTNNGASKKIESKIDGGYDFDGSDNITVSDSSSLDIENSITLEGWVKDPPILTKLIKTEVKILDKRNEVYTINNDEIFSTERTVSVNKDSKVIFIALYSNQTELIDMNIKQGSILKGVYEKNKAQNNIEEKIEDIRLKLPEELKELEFISYSNPFLIDDKETIKMDFISNLNNNTKDSRISYLAISSDDAYDYESTTHLESSFDSTNWDNPFSIYEFLIKWLSKGISDCNKISANQAKELIDSDEDIVVIDIRSQEEFSKYQIINSVSIPNLDIGCNSCLENMFKGYIDKKLILYGENDIETRKAFDSLKGLGFSYVFTLTDDYETLKNNGISVNHIDELGDINVQIENSISDEIPVFLYFYMDGCSHCLEQSPVYDELKEEYKGKIKFIKIRRSSNPAFVNKVGVTGFPTLIMLAKENNGGYVYKDFSGFKDKEFLTSFFEDTLKNIKDDGFFKSWWNGELKIINSIGLPIDIASKVSKNQKAKVIIEYKEGNSFENKLSELRDIGFEETAEVESEGLIAGYINNSIYEKIKYDNEIIQFHEDQNYTTFLEDGLALINFNESFEKFGLTGEGKKICIIDTGVDSSIVDYSYGYDFVNDDNIADDEFGHGTKVASIIKTIAPNVELVVAKVIGANGIGSESDVLEALEWCIQQDPDVISFSIGSDASCDGFCDRNLVASMSNKAVENEIFVLAAAGNDGLDRLVSPACGSNVFSVGSSDKNDNISKFSNLHPSLDILAPGEDINTVAGGGSGTSFSTAILAASSVLVLENGDEIPSQLKDRLRNTGIPIYYEYNETVNLFLPRLELINCLENNITMTAYDYSNWSQGILLGDNESYNPKGGCENACQTVCGADWVGVCEPNLESPCQSGRCNQGCYESDGQGECGPFWQCHCYSCTAACQATCGASWSGVCYDREQPPCSNPCSQSCYESDGDKACSPDICTCEQSNSAPVNGAPSFGGLHDTDNTYSQKHWYYINVTYTDADGASDFDNVRLDIRQGGTSYVGFIYDEETNVISILDGVPGVNDWMLDTDATGWESGNNINAKWKFKPCWNMINQSNLDIRLTSIDDQAASDVDTHLDEFDTVRSVWTKSIECNDTTEDGGVDRVNIGGNITMDFNVTYENDPSSGTASNVYPNDSNFTKVQVNDSSNNKEGTDSSISDGQGTVKFNLPTSVGSDTYHLFAVLEGNNFELTTTETIITDQVNVTSITISNHTHYDGSRYWDGNSDINITYNAKLNYDDSTFDGNLTAGYDGGSWGSTTGEKLKDYAANDYSAGNIVFRNDTNATNVSEGGSFGITSLMVSATTPDLGWDGENPTISSPIVTETSDYINTSGTTIYYGDDMGGAETFTVSGSATDGSGSGLWLANFTTSTLGDPANDTSAATWSGEYNSVESSDSWTGTITVTVYDHVNNTGTQEYTVNRDTTIPDVTVDDVANGETGPTNITGSSTDNVWVSDVYLYIKNVTGDTHWTGSAWGANTTLLPDNISLIRSSASSSIEWYYNSDDNGVNWGNNNYEIGAWAKDAVGNEESPVEMDKFTISSGATVPTVVTNTSSGVEEENATLNGYLSNNGSADTTCGFRFGTSSGSYSENFTVGTKNTGEEFSNDNSSLSPGQIYFYQAWASNSEGFANGTEQAFLTKPNPPSSLHAKTNSTSVIYLTWSTGTGFNTTFIERNTSGVTTWDRGEGDEIYNGTGTNYEDNGLINGLTYYYQAWTFSNWSYNPTINKWSDDNSSDSNKTVVAPTVTTNTTTNIQDTNATLNAYLQNDGGETATCGIRYGTSTGSYTENMTIGTYNTNTEYQNTNNSLTSGDLYYHQAWANNNGGFSTGSEKTFFTQPPPITSLTEDSSTNTTLTLTWNEATPGDGATAYTHLRYQTGSTPANRQEGTEAQNDTDETETETGLTPGTHYYFSAWSWAEENSKGNWNNSNTTTDIWTNPADPTGATSTNGTNWINITYTHGTNGEYTLTKRNKTGNPTYPETINDGDPINNGNTTNNYVNDTNATTGVTYYYTLWTWDTDGKKWCDNNQTITGTTLPNNAPTLSNEGPSDGTTNQDVCPIPTLNITCTDPDADTMTATWRSNSSGSWLTFATNTSIANNTNIIQTNNNFSNYSSTYYWSVNLTDGNGYWDNETYSFTTQNIQTNIDTITPYNITTSPKTITATGDTCLDNVDLYYRYSNDNSTWWNSSWRYRKTLTIDGDQVKDDFTNFPILVNITDNDLRKGPQNQGEDIVFVFNGNKLNHEIEGFDRETGALNAWVNFTSLKVGTDTDFYIYYGNSNCDNQENVSGTWDSDYLGVYHLNDVNDSSNYGKTLSVTTEGLPGNIFVGGKVYNCADLENDNRDYLENSSFFNFGQLGDYDITISTWFNVEGLDDSGDRQYTGVYVGASELDTQCMRIQARTNSDKTVIFSGQGVDLDKYSIEYGEWHYYVGVASESLDDAWSYVDGYLLDFDLNTGFSMNDQSSDDLDIGVDICNGRYFDGKIDEVRISKTARSNKWINTTYNTMANPSTFITTGDEESWMKYARDSEPSPWSFSFNFPNGTGYYEFYSIGIKQGSTSETAPITKDAGCYYNPESNTAPWVKDNTEAPVNTNTNIDICPVPALYVVCWDNDTADTMNATWRSNSSGAWVTFASNTSIANNTNITQTNSNFSNYSSTYYWSVNLTDGEGGWDNKTFSFTTQTIETNVDIIDPYEKTSSPLTVTATGDTCIDNVTLYYRHSASNHSWWNISFHYRKKITIDHDQVGSDLTNFPILISITDANLNSNAQSDGDDIVFTNATGTKLNHELESYNSGTGALVAWVNVTSLSSSTDTEIYMYYGNSTCSSQQNAIDTWNSDYEAVYHLNEASGTVFDSTNNNVDGSSSGGVTYGQTGKVGNCLQFATNGKVDLGNAVAGFDSSTVTVETWVKTTDASGTDTRIVTIGEEATNKWVLNKVHNTNGNKAIFSNTDSSHATPATNNAINDGTWHYLVGKTSPESIFLNGSAQSSTISDSWSFEANSTIGSRGTTFYFNGYIDEVRISSTIRDSNWITTTYNTMSNKSTFLSTSNEESWTSFGADEDSAWSWNFNFPNGTGYYEFYSVGKKSGSIDEIAPFVGDASCYYNPPANTAPWVKDNTEAPVNTTTNICPIPNLHAICIDNDTVDTMNATWKSNSSGTWLDFATNTSINNNTNITQTNNNFSSPGTKYWWSINLTDGNNAWNNKTFSFTTNYEPTQSGEAPYNGKTDVSTTPTLHIICSDTDSDTMTATWRYNESNNWWTFATNTSISTGTNITQTNSNFSNYSSTYYWSVNLTDGCNWTNTTYHFTTESAPASLPIVTTNTSTGVEEENATLNGYLSNNGSADTTCGFRFGTSSGSYSENFTVGTIANLSEFNNNNESLDPGQIYFYQAWAKNSVGFANGTEQAFLTKPNATTSGSLNVQTNSSSILYLTWTAGDGANNTYIERNASAVTTWDRGEGDVIYNGTGTSYEDTGLAAGTTYYYQAWSFTNWTYNPTVNKWSDENESGSNQTNNKPLISNENPTNESTGISLNPTLEIDVNHNDEYQMNISWYWGTDSSCPDLLGSNLSVNNGTFSQADLNNNFSSNSQKYYWKVCVNDGHGEWTNETFEFTTINANKGIISKTQSAYSLEISPAGTTLYGYINSNSVSGAIDANWHYVALTYDGSDIKIYKDGELLDNTSYSGSINTNNNDLTLGDSLTGTLDELRVSSGSKSAGYINTSFYNTNSPSTFASFGNQEGVLKTWSYRKKIWINSSLIDNNLPYFPVLISTTDANLQSNALSSGNDIIFMKTSYGWTTSSYTNRLPHEVEVYNSGTGQLVAWVNVTDIDSSSNSSIYMYYGNTVCTENREDAANVWDSDYIGVWHLQESTGNYIDSTSNDNHGTTVSVNSRSATAKIGTNCPNFDGSDDYIQIPHDANMNCNGQSMTIEAWVNSNDYTSEQHIIGKNGNGDDEGWNSELYDQNDIMLQSGEGSSYMDMSTGNSLSTNNQWYHISLIWDTNANNASFYIDSNKQTHNAGNDDLRDWNAVTNDTYIGISKALGSDQYPFDGEMDEIRLSDIARNSTWINACFNNTNDSNNFTEFGIQEIQNVAPTQSSPSPSDGATGQSQNPALSITVGDTNGDAMNVTFWTNATGTWGLIGYNDSSYNGTYQQTNSSMDSYSTKYWWSVNVTDDALWTNQTYNFTTSNLVTVNITSINEDGSIWYDGGSYTRFNLSTTLNISYYDIIPGRHNNTYIEWNISSIPDSATIVNTSFKYHGVAARNNLEIYAMEHQPSHFKFSDQDVYNDTGDGTTYVADFDLAKPGNQILDLGSSADSDLEDQLLVNWFAIGISDTVSPEGTVGSIYSNEAVKADPYPTLMVQYYS